MSDINEHLHTTVNEVRNILKQYAAIHDDVFGFSLKKAIPLPFLFKAIDFEQSSIKSGEFVLEMEKLKERLHELKSEAPQSEFADILLEFCTSIIEAISLLKEITQQLDLKDKKMAGYTLEQHKQLVDSYSESAEQYRSIATKLAEYL